MTLQTDRLLAAWLPGDLVFISCPYGSGAAIKRNMTYFEKVDAKILGLGIHTHSPLAKHYSRQHNKDLGGDWNFWEQYCLRLLRLSTMMVIIMTPGWEESVGVAAEIKEALRLGLKIIYLNPDVFLSE